MFFSACTFGQKRGAVWCFGDSALVDFGDTSNITTGTSAVKSRGSCSSISDKFGDLLFYTAYDPTTTIGGTDPVKVYGQNNVTIANGDSIKGGGWYHELTIIPYPDSDSLYYVFNIGVTLDFGFYYSIVDMSLNGGLGGVTQKNVQLENFKTVDCLSAVKHGNGRDWWVIIRKSDIPSGSNNDYFVYLITPSGVSSQPIQSVGSQNSTNSGRISFNSNGTRMSFINYKGLIELYDFDRCSGIISNPVTIQPESSQAPWPACWSAEFSPSGNLVYLTRIAAFSSDSCYLTQFDLTAANRLQSGTILWQTSFLENMGQLKLAANGKIYLANNYGGGYPYSDSLYNFRNMNLSVINSPDSLGFGCDLEPYSFYLGGKRTYFGLPNNPDYDLTALIGSPCDTLTSLNEISPVNVAGLYVYYSPQWQTAFINADKLSGTIYRVSVYDLMGKEVFSESGKITPPYFTKNLNCGGWAKGMYVVSLESGAERLTKRFVID